MFDEIQQKVVACASKKILYLPHAIKQMSRPDRMLSTEEIKRAVLRGKIIEHYPLDARGESCLILYAEERAVHLVCSPKHAYLAIITAYLPDPAQWSPDFTRRR